MAGAIKTPVYKDFDLNMKMHPVTGKLIVRKNSDAVKQAIKTLILTDRGERPFRPVFGSDIRYRLFDLMDPAIESMVKSDVLSLASKRSEFSQISALILLLILKR